MSASGYFRPVIEATPSATHGTVRDKWKQSWLHRVFHPPLFEYSVNEINDLPEPVVIPCNNDYNLSQEDKESLWGELQDGTIVQFLKRTSMNIDELAIFSFRPISSVTEQRKQTKNSLLNIPAMNVSDIYIRVDVLSISIHGDADALQSCPGFMLLYDLDRKSIASDLLYFHVQNQSVVFTSSHSNSAFFHLRRNESNVVLVAVLERNDSMVSLPIPFAYSYLDLFNKHPESGFLFPWSLISNNDWFEWDKPSKYESVPVITKVAVNVIREKDVSDFKWITMNDEASPVLYRSFPQMLFDEVCSLILSGFQLSFNSMPKGEFLFLKLFVCEKATDPFNPISIPVLLQDNKLVTCYNSRVVRAGRKAYIPDVVRIVLDKELDSRTHLVVHVMVINKRVHTIAKVCVVPLFQDDVMALAPNESAFMHPVKKIRSEDYLTRAKAVTKSIVNYNVDIPYAQFPPKYVNELDNVMVPQQVNWSLITQNTAPDVLAYLVVPITCKLLSLMSPQTAEYMIDLLSILDSQTVTDTVRRWLYTHFDPKQIKHNFLSSFTNSFDQMLQSAMLRGNKVLIEFSKYFDVVSDIMLISFNRRTEDWIPTSIFGMLNRISATVRYFIETGDVEHARILSSAFGKFMFTFLTVSNDSLRMMKSIQCHIRELLAVEKVESILAIFEFMQPFTVTNEFAMFCAKQLPVKPLNEILFSPFHPMISLLCRAESRAFHSGNNEVIDMSVTFFRDLLMPLENTERPLSYRAGFAFFPVLDILSSLYEAQLDLSAQFRLIPSILFLIAYTPTQLLKNFFASASTGFRAKFVDFLVKVTEVCISKLDSNETTLVNGLFDQLTQRFLHFLYINITKLDDCIHSVVKLVSLFASPFQISKNYPRMFDIVSRIIKYYPCQRLLVTNLLEVLMLKQHIARCYATSLIIMFFKADFDARKSVTISSVEVIDTLTSLLLTSPIEQISMYKKMIERIKNLMSLFRIDLLTAKLEERMTAAMNIADVIEKLRLATHPPDERCIYAMHIANQHKTFPSMRMKWLKEIVRINTESGSYASAFVSQLHVCALVSTVIAHEQSLKNEYKAPSRQFNLLLTQPIRGGRTNIPIYNIHSQDFAFMPSVMAETNIDFASISSDFQFISSDFNMDLLKDSLHEALEYGVKARLYYSVRPVASLLMRIYSTERAYKELADTSNTLKDIFHHITASVTNTHDTNLNFYVCGQRVYCLEENAKMDMQDAIFVRRLDRKPDELEHPHSWSVFRNIVSKDTLKSVSSFDAQEITLIQYTTKEALPRYTTFSEIAEKQEVTISLVDYVRLEAEKLGTMMRKTSSEFEKCFPCRKLTAVCGTFNQSIERDMNRIVALFKATLDGDNSLFELMKLLVSKNGKDKATEFAAKIRLDIERLTKVYHRAIEYLQSPEHFIVYKEMRDLVVSFVAEFALRDIDTKSYEGRCDPLTDHMDYETW